MCQDMANRLSCCIRGGSDSRALDPLIAELDGTYACFTPDQRAHGRSRDVPGPLTFEAMAANTVAFSERSADTPVHLLGYSDGAIVALYVALARPDLVRSLVFAAAVFHYEGWLPGVLDGEVPSFMGDSYGEVSPDGREHWPVVVAKLDALHAVAPALTVDDLATLTVPTLVMLGDDDEVHGSDSLIWPRGDGYIWPHRFELAGGLVLV